MASRGRLHEPLEQAGFQALDGARLLGYATYDVRDGEMEIVVLESSVRGRGVGSALIAACVGAALARRLKRVWLVTTNDNLRALRFYQRRGFVLVALRPGAVDEARRKLKPEIGLIGNDDIPIRDELELELPKESWPAFVERYAWPSA